MKQFLLILGFFVGMTSLHAQNNYFENEQHNFQIQYPMTWQLSDMITENIAFVALAPQATKKDFRENINVTVLPTSTTHLGLAVEDNIAVLQKIFPDIKIENKGIALIGNQHAGFFTYTCTLDAHPKKKKIKSIAYVLLMDNKEYVITCASAQKQFKRNLPFFEQMVSSFHFLFRLNA